MSESQELAQSALALFRLGLDTFDIARKLGIPEARASRLLWVARCHAKGLPADFRTKGRTIRRIAPQAETQAA